jgi:hypothetical protein
MKAHGGVDVWVRVFLTLAVVGGEWSVSLPDRITLGERVPIIHWIGGCMGPRTGLDDVEIRKILSPPGLRTLGRPARSQSLYRLRYRGSFACRMWHVSHAAHKGKAMLSFALFDVSLHEAGCKSRESFTNIVTLNSVKSKCLKRWGQLSALLRVPGTKWIWTNDRWAGRQWCFLLLQDREARPSAGHAVNVSVSCRITTGRQVTTNYANVEHGVL